MSIGPRPELTRTAPIDCCAITSVATRKDIWGATTTGSRVATSCTLVHTFIIIIMAVPPQPLVFGFDVTEKRADTAQRPVVVDHGHPAGRVHRRLDDPGFVQQLQHQPRCSTGHS